MTRRFVFVWAVVIVPMVVVSPADACAPAPPPGVEVTIADESAVIAWDEATKVQHFIRRATFHARRTGAGDAPTDFGFLVPTPSKPELAEASDELFWQLEHFIAPKVQHNRPLFFPTALCLIFSGGMGRKAGGPPVSAVQVLEQKRVAGYDAAILQASDAGALAGWLSAHGYDSPDWLEQYLAVYVAKKWTITAFKIAADVRGTAATSAVRMSFPTERPFFPYREPLGQPAAATPGRLLRVYFLGSAQVEGFVGETSTGWAGRTVFSDAAGPGLGLVQRPWLTVLEDSSSPRPGSDDVWFQPSSQNQRIVPAPVVVEWSEGRIPIPIDLLLVTAAGVVFFAARRRNR